MVQKWRSLLFLHWVFEPEAVAAFLPPGLELDLYEGKAYVGLVPFTMRGIRPVGLPAVPWLSNFHETNVRTYVHVNGRDPGVWFFSLEAANPIAVQLARSLFYLPYHHARMSLTHEPSGAIAYRSTRTRAPVGCDITGAPVGPITPAVVGTLEHFLLERYLLYSAHGDKLYRGQVHHAPYPARAALALHVEENLLAANGLTRPDHPPLAHYAEGVDVDIYALQRVVKG
jgi:uncharacterized protein YqjF (DUF2071 family)